MQRLSHKRPCEDDVSQELADGDADDGNDYVGTHEAEHYRYGTAEKGQKGEEAHPCSMTRHETLRLVETLLLDVQIFLYPVKTPHASYAVVEHRTENVADGGIDDELRRIPFARNEHTQYDCLAGEWKETSGEKGGNEHTPGAILYEKIKQSEEGG